MSVRDLLGDSRPRLSGRGAAGNELPAGEATKPLLAVKNDSIDGAAVLVP